MRWPWRCDAARAVANARENARRAQVEVEAAKAVLAAVSEDHQKATDKLLAAIEEQRKGWASDV